MDFDVIFTVFENYIVSEGGIHPQLLIKRQIQVKLCNVHIKNIKTSF